MVFLKEFFEKVNFEKNLQTTKKHAKLPACKELNNEMSRDMSFQQCGMSDQQKLRSGCAYVQTDQCLC